MLSNTLKNKLYWLSSLLGLLLLAKASYIHIKAHVAQWLLQNSWQQTLEQTDKQTNKLTNKQTRVKPWPWADTWPVAKLAFPAQQQEFVVLHGGHGQSLAFAPAWLSDSAEPNQPGSTLIAGHKDTHFALIKNLKTGQIIKLQNTAGQWQDYQVSQTFMMDTRYEQLTHIANQQELLLITCYSFSSVDYQTPFRYVVYAEVYEQSLNNLSSG